MNPWKSKYIQVAVLICLTFATEESKASFIFNMVEVGTSVIVNGSGSLNTAALTPYTFINPFGYSYLWAQSGQLEAGPTTLTGVKGFTDLSGPSNFSVGGQTMDVIATSGTGDAVGISPSILTVPSAYISETYLIDNCSFANSSFSSLMIRPGTYVYTWGSGSTADSLTLNIGVVPEPASAAALGVPVALTALRRRPRRRLV